MLFLRLDQDNQRTTTPGTRFRSARRIRGWRPKGGDRVGFPGRVTAFLRAQNATTVTSESLGRLPKVRNLAAAVALAPGTSNTGPSGNTVLSGARSFENLYLVYGVAVQDNIRNAPCNLFIEDAIQEQTVTTSGISAGGSRATAT